MEKRIRFVWILSLISIFLLVGVQAYWLSNQYKFVVEEYSRQLGMLILKAGEDEYKLRKEEKKMDYTFAINTRRAYNNKKDSINNSFAFAFVYQDSIKDESFREKKLMELLSVMDTLHPDKRSENFLSSGTAPQMKLNINQRLPQDTIQLFANMAATNLYNPFTTERLDSVLHSDIPTLHYIFSEWPANDSVYISDWTRTGSIFHPGLRVKYAYSPFEQKGIVIDADIPTQPLFKSMAIQLLLACSIILLSLVCLIFQIRTILKQKKINELRKNFVNTMIHELKRPVQTLKTFIGFLGDKDMRTDDILTEQVVQDSMFELDNLSAYLGKLKDMVRADGEETLLNLQRFDLRELTDKVIRLIQIPAGKKVEFSRFFDMEFHSIEADPIHLANVLTNLIENAIKYSGSHVNIEIKAKQKGNELWLTVSDNGIGIPTVEQDRVFAKFYRGSNLPDQNIPGLGLGLSYVKLISEAHRGNVSLQSKLGIGTSVTLILPQ